MGSPWSLGPPSPNTVAFVEARLPAALDPFEELILLTHVPPFREAAWHEGKVSNDDWLPFMASKPMGDVLKDALAARPDRKVTVLCGHTHSAGEVEILPNLIVKTGGAEYRNPELQLPIVV